jgi:hypothetical protein
MKAIKREMRMEMINNRMKMVENVQMNCKIKKTDENPEEPHKSEATSTQPERSFKTA